MSDDTRTLNGGMHDASATPKHSFLKWYPSDWRGDANLRAVSLAARGLWIECLGLMHGAEQYGVLRLNGEPLTPERIAPRVGASAAEVAALLAELEREGVCSRAEDGAIVCRRMLRDAERAARDRANGLKGGNPRLRVIPGGRGPGGGSGAGSGSGSGAGGGGAAEGSAAASAAPAGVKGGVNPGVNGGVKARARAARGQNLDKEPLTPTPCGAGGLEAQAQSEAEEARPPGWVGQWHGTRAAGNNPRALAAAEAKAAAGQVFASPLWPVLRGHLPAERFAVLCAGAVFDPPDADGVGRLVAAKRWQADALRAEVGHALARLFAVPRVEVEARAS